MIVTTTGAIHARKIPCPGTADQQRQESQLGEGVEDVLDGNPSESPQAHQRRILQDEDRPQQHRDHEEIRQCSDVGRNV